MYGIKEEKSHYQPASTYRAAHRAYLSQMLYSGKIAIYVTTNNGYFHGQL